MQAIKNKVNEFLFKYGMHYESIDIAQNCDIFTKEMENGLEGSESSLDMIPTYISMDKELPLEEPIIVVDAGGTNFRVAVVYFDKCMKPVIQDFNLYPMPGTQGELSKKEFFSAMAKYLSPIIGKSKKIGFCFSYSTIIFPNRDGRLTRFSKEIQAKEVEGEFIGENLLKALNDMGHEEEKSIVLLNDTVATLLGGKASQGDREFDSYVGFILGTGTNTCYIEKVDNIKKIQHMECQESTMLINAETGAYGKAPRGKIDVEFDNGTSNPGDYGFEKMISGGYQGGIMLAVIKKAAEDGLFSDGFANRISEVKELTSKEIDQFLYRPYSDENTLALCCSDDKDDAHGDRIVLYYLIDAIFERAAKLVTINLSSVILKTGKGKNPCKPVCITAEGTTFYKSKLFRTKLDCYMKSYLEEQKNIYYEFVKVDNATLIGTAIAGLLNG